MTNLRQWNESLTSCSRYMKVQNKGQGQTDRWSPPCRGSVSLQAACRRATHECGVLRKEVDASKQFNPDESHRDNEPAALGAALLEVEAEGLLDLHLHLLRRTYLLHPQTSGSAGVA